jgi:hypothetical protein
LVVFPIGLQLYKWLYSGEGGENRAEALFQQLAAGGEDTRPVNHLVKDHMKDADNLAFLKAKGGWTRVPEKLAHVFGKCVFLNKKHRATMQSLQRDIAIVANGYHAMRKHLASGGA